MRHLPPYNDDLKREISYLYRFASGEGGATGSSAGFRGPTISIAANSRRMQELSAAWHGVSYKAQKRAQTKHGILGCAKEGRTAGSISWDLYGPRLHARCRVLELKDCPRVCLSENHMGILPEKVSHICKSFKIGEGTRHDVGYLPSLNS